MTKQAKGWAVKGPYDTTPHPHRCQPKRTQAINVFTRHYRPAHWPENWQYAYRRGYRCVPVILTWEEKAVDDLAAVDVEAGRWLPRYRRIIVRSVLRSLGLTVEGDNG